MCVVWTQKQWKQAIDKKNGEYNLLGTYTNAAGETAIQVVEKDGWVYNIYSQDGRDMNMYPSQEPAEEQMASRGFKPAAVVVQGKTIAQWAEEGVLNATRTEHVHPKKTEGEPTDAEVEALVASLSAEEATIFFMSLLLGEAIEATSVYA